MLRFARSARPLPAKGGWGVMLLEGFKAAPPFQRQGTTIAPIEGLPRGGAIGAAVVPEWRRSRTELLQGALRLAVHDLSAVWMQDLPGHVCRISRREKDIARSDFRGLARTAERDVRPERRDPLTRK